MHADLEDCVESVIDKRRLMTGDEALLTSIVPQVQENDWDLFALLRNWIVCDVICFNESSKKKRFKVVVFVVVVVLFCFVFLQPITKKIPINKKY